MFNDRCRSDYAYVYVPRPVIMCVYLLPRPVKFVYLMTAAGLIKPLDKVRVFNDRCRSH